MSLLSNIVSCSSFYMWAFVHYLIVVMIKMQNLVNYKTKLNSAASKRMFTSLNLCFTYMSGNKIVVEMDQTYVNKIPNEINITKFPLTN